MSCHPIAVNIAGRLDSHHMGRVGEGFVDNKRPCLLTKPLCLNVHNISNLIVVDIPGSFGGNNKPPCLSTKYYCNLFV